MTRTEYKDNNSVIQLDSIIKNDIWFNGEETTIEWNKRLRFQIQDMFGKPRAFLTNVAKEAFLKWNEAVLQMPDSSTREALFAAASPFLYRDVRHASRRICIALRIARLAMKQKYIKQRAALNALRVPILVKNDIWFYGDETVSDYNKRLREQIANMFGTNPESMTETMVNAFCSWGAAVEKLPANSTREELFSEGSTAAWRVVRDSTRRACAIQRATTLAVRQACS